VLACGAGTARPVFSSIVIGGLPHRMWTHAASAALHQEA
jgi:hypothetical protein